MNRDREELGASIPLIVCRRVSHGMRSDGKLAIRCGRTLQCYRRAIRGRRRHPTDQRRATSDGSIDDDVRWHPIESRRLGIDDGDLRDHAGTVTGFIRRGVGHFRETDRKLRTRRMTAGGSCASAQISCLCWIPGSRPDAQSRGRIKTQLRGNIGEEWRFSIEDRDFEARLTGVSSCIDCGVGHQGGPDLKDASTRRISAHRHA